MPALDIAIAAASLLPRVEDPWPETISIEFPFAAAGVGGVLANVFYTGSQGAGRDETIRDGGLLGFWLGALFYALSFFNQVVSA